jgi:Cu/Ag efflux pump CusA
MMRWIVGTSLRSRGLVVALGVAVMLLGVTELRKMPKDVLPEFGPPTVEVQTEALGLSAEEVEQLITVPLEQDLLNGVAFLDFIRSESVPGLSRIEMIFESGTDPGDARQVVNERLTQAHALPHVSKPPQMLQPLSSTSRVMMVGLSSKSKSLIDMSLLAKWTIRPALMGLPGVANVSMWGHREEQLQVQVDPLRLEAEGVSLDQIIRTTGNALWVSDLTFLEASTPGTPGFFDTATQRFGLQHIQPIKTPEDLSKVTIERDPSAPVDGGADEKRLGDVTNVVEDHQPLIGDAVFTDGPGLLLVVEKLPEANALEVTRDLDKTLKNLEPGLTGIQVDSSFFRPARYLEKSTDNLRTALLIGLVLLMLALGALLFELRTAFVALFAIVLSLAAAVAILYARGETINAMVVAGLVLALVVLIDDAIVSADSIRRESSKASLASVLAVRGPLAYGTVILLLALLPIFVMNGEAGAFLPSLVLSYAGAVLASMLVALTVTPALSMLLLSNAPAGRTSPVVERLPPRYDRVFSRFIRTPRAGLVTVAVLLLLGLAVLPLLDRGSSLVPEFKDRDLLIHLDGAPGTSLPEMQRITAKAGLELRGLRGVSNVGGHAGRAELGDQVVNVNSSELWVSLDPSADYDRTLAAVEEVVNGYPGIDRSVLTYPKERINDVLKTPDGVEGKDLTVRVFGQDLGTLRTTAYELRDSMMEVDGVDAPRVELPVQQPTLEVEVDLERAQELGVKPGDVRRAAAAVLSGVEAGKIFEAQKIFQVVVWGTPATRTSLANVRQLLIDRPNGAGQVRLDEVADVRVKSSPNAIRHEDVSRYVDVGVDVRGRDIDAVASDIEERIAATDFDLEYHAELLGDYQDKQSARLAFIGASVAAAVGILLLLHAAFASWRMASVLFVALPGALTGGAVAALIDGDLISIGSLVGFLAVFGLAARNSVVLVKRCQDLEDLEGEAFGPELVRRAARERLAPAVMSAVTTALVLLPLLFFGGLAGHELVHPMAAVILGGLVTSTVLNLLVVPALYLRFGSRPEGRERFDMVLDLRADERGEEVRHTPSMIDA